MGTTLSQRAALPRPLFLTPEGNAAAEDQFSLSPDSRYIKCGEALLEGGGAAGEPLSGDQALLQQRRTEGELARALPQGRREW
jgi:hypothetical protein